jgi:hypothetical protein
VDRERAHSGDRTGTPAGLLATDKECSLVDRIDPAGNVVLDTFRAGPGAYAVARLGRSMWITSFAGDDVRRFDPSHR